MRRLKKELWPICVSYHEYSESEIENWLNANVGSWKDKWIAIYFSNSTDYYFRNEQDATLFSLRWL